MGLPLLEVNHCLQTVKPSENNAPSQRAVTESDIFIFIALNIEITSSQVFFKCDYYT